MIQVYTRITKPRPGYYFCIDSPEAEMNSWLNEAFVSFNQPGINNFPTVWWFKTGQYSPRDPAAYRYEIFVYDEADAVTVKMRWA